MEEAQQDSGNSALAWEKSIRLAALREVLAMVEMWITEARITSQYAKGFYKAKGHIHDGIMEMIKREEEGR